MSAGASRTHAGPGCGVRPGPEGALARLEALHEAVSRAAGRLVAAHAGRLHCRRGCASCCADGLRVWDVEAALIRRRHGRLLARGRPHPPGACAFLDRSGACRIYADRPYVCRTQGLPLRWRQEGACGRPVELRDICPRNEAGPPLEDLPAAACWAIGPWEARLAECQRRFGGGRMRRTGLRRLFACGKGC